MVIICNYIKRDDVQVAFFNFSHCGSTGEAVGGNQLD